LNEDLVSVREELATLPPDVDGSLSAAFATAYSLQLSALTEQYVTEEIASLTQSAPVLRFGDASTPFSTEGIKKFGLFGIMGGIAVAAGLGLLMDLLRKWQAGHIRNTAAHPTFSSSSLERLLVMANETTTRRESTQGYGTGTTIPRTGNRTTAGD